jgi:hypothetical protein
MRHSFSFKISYRRLNHTKLFQFRYSIAAAAALQSARYHRKALAVATDWVSSLEVITTAAFRFGE